MVETGISESLLSRYCLADEVRWWFSAESPMEYDYPIVEPEIVVPGSECMIGDVPIPSLAFDIDPTNLEKRTRAIVDLLEDPGKTEKYIRNMATKLQIKCINAGRHDLSADISQAKSKKLSPEEKKIRQARREQIKEKMAEMF